MHDSAFSNSSSAGLQSRTHLMLHLIALNRFPNLNRQLPNCSVCATTGPLIVLLFTILGLLLTSLLSDQPQVSTLRDLLLLTSLYHYPEAPPCTVLNRTGSTISRFQTAKTQGKKNDFLLSSFITLEVTRRVGCRRGWWGGDISLVR